MEIKISCFLWLSMLMLSWHGQTTKAAVRISLRRNKPNLGNVRLNSTIFETAKNRIELQRHEHTLYYGNIGIGTPTLNFQVLFDTGSADLLIPSKDWLVPEAIKYDHSQSLTYIKNGEPAQISYDATTVDGFLSQDDVTVGDVTVKNQIFIEATKETGPTRFEYEPFDGIFGLAFQEASVRGLVPAWYKILDQDGVERKIFSLWLKYYDPKDEEGGAIIFGGSDPTHFIGEHTYVPVSQGYYWEFLMHELLIGGTRTSHCINGCSVFVDSGNSVVMGPSEIIKKINKAIGVDIDGRVDCTKLPTLPKISFTIGERVFSLSPRDYIVNVQNTLCSTSFKVNKISQDYHAANHWILGLPFMRRVHTIFDYENKKLGFADAVQLGE